MQFGRAIALLASVILVQQSRCVRSAPQKPIEQSNEKSELAVEPRFEHLVTTLERCIDDQVRTGQFSGVVLLSRKGRAVLQRAHGLADLQTNTPNRLETRFNIASSTKMFTAVAVIQLVEGGKLSLSAPVSTYLPTASPDLIGQATIHQLLTHSAGMGEVIRSPEFRETPQKFKTVADYYDVLKTLPVNSSWRNEFHYGDGYILLGAVIEAVTGQSFYDYVRQQVFMPAGMNDTGFDLVPAPRGVATGYTGRDLSDPKYPKREGPLQSNAAIFPTRASPSAGAYSTAGDLVRFASALLDHRLMGRASLDLLWSGKVDTRQPPPNQHYAYGFFAGAMGSTQIINHGGTGPGIDVAFDIYPQLGYEFVALANRDPPAAQVIRTKVRSLLTAVEAEVQGFSSAPPVESCPLQ